MDKNIIDKLIKYGLITNIGIDADKYENIDELINKGIITIPGAKQKILELISEESKQEVEPATTVIKPVNDTTNTVIVKEDIIETVEPVVEPVIEPVNDTTNTVIVKEDIIETVEPTTVVIEPEKTPEVEPVVESTPKRKKQTKTIE